ncbi:MAG: NAD(P)/FAD-dependent oxidoreductase, partial [Oscillospiraceae bacterium]|nr:NAD(P)/FAD-dependent oxidoreductase [Oscillospiraceae bacterium]
MAHSNRIIVAGGGGAGIMAGVTRRAVGAGEGQQGPNEKVGRKLYITGKGRCNVTNNCGRDGLMAAVPRNGRFLYSAFSRFSPQDTMAFFEKLGVPLKTERGNRVFPQSDKAADIVDALFFALRCQGVELRRDRVTGLATEDGRLAAVTTEEAGELRDFGALILATGGASYPRTGSTGDGYRLARAVGHRIVPIRGSLVPLESEDPCCGRLQGLSLRNVGLRVKDQKGRTVFQEQGELLFTHFGLSGPLVLSASAHMDFSKSQYTAHIDLKPALDKQKLDARLLRDFRERINQDYANALSGLVPRSMVPVLAERTGIPGDTKVHDIRREQRRRLLEVLKDFAIPLTGPRPVEEAVVTSGGVAVGEVDPKTMES